MLDPLFVCLVIVAFQAEPFAKNRRVTSLMKVGEEGPRMIVIGQRQGMLLWRPTEAVPQHAPQQITAELRKDIIRDIKIKKAFQHGAIAKAQEVLEAARTEGLEAAAKAGNMESTTTGFWP